MIIYEISFTIALRKTEIFVRERVKSIINNE